MKPGLFGIVNSNRDFTREDSWGKNKFNNAFPVSLACYMWSKSIEPVYFILDNNLNLVKNFIPISNLFRMDPDSEEIFYSFEDRFLPYLDIIPSNLPGIDLVIKNIENGMECVASLEIKLTTLPDHTTCNFTDDKYGSEIVVRPDTIVYLALSIAKSLERNRERLFELLEESYNRVIDWKSHVDIMNNIEYMVIALNNVMKEFNDFQKPLLMQPVWKTKGKSAILSENCLDIFVWSDFSFTKLFIRPNLGSALDRNNRTIVWLFLMLYEFALKGTIDHRSIIDNYTYDTKNDKAFAVSGIITNQIMKCDELTTPRIKKDEIKNIILNNGQNYLSPERRFDGVLQSDITIFQ